MDERFIFIFYCRKTERCCLKMFFNYTELAITSSLKEKVKICETLEANGIDYKIDTLGTAIRNIGMRGIAVDPVGENQAVSCEYKILVHKKRLQLAKHLIGN
ncbi:hypothetical protein DWV06_11265 [Anaerosacchariphilus polymeriproducens]|uniref:DUF2007 domain-containing protein n=2 Tax=Anaerosacchariphilus polymeriproducens TaxID=1812858 RepID=A0A371ATP2_9FIRM|nr:hypothetical protein DWV06_11265 [Anaerosacchariphilus polymeriproducens]